MTDLLCLPVGQNRVPGFIALNLKDSKKQWKYSEFMLFMHAASLGFGFWGF